MKISFIIVEYNSVEDVLVCQSSIVEQVPSGWLYEIIVSSNSLYLPVKQRSLIAQNSTLKWVFNEKNGGFAYAMNRGLAAASGDILVIMNPDVKLKSDVRKMLDYLCFHHEVGVIAPKIVNSKGEIQDSFRDFVTPINFIKRHITRMYACDEIGVGSLPEQVDWVIGAFMMMPRQVYELVNGLDEHYFLYCEDMDLCKRIHQKGYYVIYYPEVEIEYEGTRSARKSWKYAVIFLKSLLRYWGKYGFC